MGEAHVVRPSGKPGRTGMAARPRGRAPGVIAACLLSMGGLGCALDGSPSDGETQVRLQVRLHGTAGSAAATGAVLAERHATPGAALQSLLAPAPIEFDQIDEILVDVRREVDGQALLTGFPLVQSEPGVWGAELPFLPRNQQLRFHAEAFDASEEMGFVGDTLVTLSADAEDVVVPLSSLQDGETFAMPRVEAIRYPAEIAAGQEVQIVFSLAGNQDQRITYSIDTEPGQGSFQPAAGSLTLNGALTDFIVLYTAPEVTEDATLAHAITLHADQGLSSVDIETNFDTAVRATEPGTVVDTSVYVRFNPVVRTLTLNGTSAPGSVILTADVSDDGPAESISYAWTYTPDEETPAASFANAGAGNPGILEGYTVAHQGVLTLAISDADNGVTTLYYELVPNQFADVITDDPAAGLARVLAGRAHTCALTGDGRVRCWGDNTYGQLGYGDSVNVGDSVLRLPYAAGDVPLGEPVKQLAVGDDHTCALTLAGAVYCWGKNHFGQLGYGTTQNLGDSEPVLSFGYVSLDGLATRIAAGGDHTCAIVNSASMSGGLRCWGRNDAGQLGVGDTFALGDDEEVFGLSDIPLGGPVADVVLGGSHTCALLQSGAVRCWGENAYGRLGYGHTQRLGDDETLDELTDVAMPGPVRKLVAGEAHTCALFENGGVRCWGQGNYGALGHGSTSHWGDSANKTPATAADIATGGQVVDIAAGAQHTCALLTSSEVTCWGAGSAGRLGYGNVSNRNTPGPGLDLGQSNAFQIAAGGVHTCVIDNAGAVRCWGEGGAGRLGTGTPAAVLAAGDALIAPVLAEGPGCTDTGEDSNEDGVPDACNSVTAVVAGSAHTCALLDTGRVRCWGRSDFGQLGYASTASVGASNHPASVGDVDVGGRVIQLVAGDHHTCALLETGSVRCWGVGSVGQLGYGNIDNIGDTETPASAGNVDVGGRVIQLAAGYAHTCALLETGSVRCWGYGAQGRLGYGNTDDIGDTETPASAGDVDVGGAVAELAAGGGHTCAILSDGRLRCWGYGSYGQLGTGSSAHIGDGETPASVSPVPFNGPVVQVVAGEYHTCARLRGGTVRCWGRSNYGQLGYHSTSTLYSPGGDVNLGGPALHLSTSNDHNCAVLEGGVVRCWGHGGNYKLGYGEVNNVGDNEHPYQAGPVNLGGPAYGVAAGGSHSCAVVSGAVRCWGSGNYGQLGYASTSDRTTPGPAVQLF